MSITLNYWVVSGHSIPTFTNTETFSSKEELIAYYGTNPMQHFDSEAMPIVCANGKTYDLKEYVSLPD